MNKCIIGKNYLGSKIPVLVFLVNTLLALNTATAVAASGTPANIRGHIVVKDHKSYLMNEQKQLLELSATNETVAADLDALETGDYLAGNGEYGPTRVTIDAIEFIGLRRLLGLWIDRDNQLMFNFRDFSRAGVRTFSNPGEKQLQYALVPDQANRWTIFLGDTQSVAVGILTHFQSVVRIDMINSDTGQIERTIRLQPLRPQR